MIKLHKISEDPEKTIFSDLWGCDMDTNYYSWWMEKCDALTRHFSKQKHLDTYHEFVSSTTSKLSKMSLKVIINKNMHYRASIPSAKNLDRIDFCFHDKNRLASNTCLTMYFNKDKLNIIMIGSKKYTLHLPHEEYDFYNILNALPPNPLIFNSNPHFSAKGNREYQQSYFSKFSPTTKKLIVDDVVSIFSDLIYFYLPEEIIRHNYQYDFIGPFNKSHWPINRFEVKYLPANYANKASEIQLNNNHRKAIIHNGLISEPLYNKK